MRNLFNGNRVARNTTFSDGINVLTIKGQKAKLEDLSMCNDGERDYTVSAIFDLNDDLKKAFTTVLKEELVDRVMHCDILCNRVITDATVNDWSGTIKSVRVAITIAYDPRCHRRVMYLYDITARHNAIPREMPILGIELKVDRKKNYSQVLCDLAR